MKLEKVVGHRLEVLRLPDGKEVRYEPEEIFAAMSASIRKEEHWLLPYCRQTDTTTGMVGLVRSLELARQRVEEGKRWGA